MLPSIGRNPPVPFFLLMSLPHSSYEVILFGSIPGGRPARRGRRLRRGRPRPVGGPRVVDLPALAEDAVVRAEPVHAVVGDGGGAAGSAAGRPGHGGGGSGGAGGG